MTVKESKRAEWGEARLAFWGLARDILAELDRPVPRTKVYARFKERLGMSYSQFCYWVRTYRQKENGAVDMASSFDAASRQPAAVRKPLHAGPERQRASRSDAPANSSSSVSPRPSAQNQAVPSKPEPDRDFHFDPTDAYRFKFD